VEEGETKMFMKFFALLIVPLVYESKVGFQGVGGGRVGGVKVRAKSCFLNSQGKSDVLGGG
jgi:hypothetical protein